MLNRQLSPQSNEIKINLTKLNLIQFLIMNKPENWLACLMDQLRTQGDILPNFRGHEEFLNNPPYAPLLYTKMTNKLSILIIARFMVDVL